MIRNRAAHLVFNQVKHAQVTICFISLHSLSVAASLLRDQWSFTHLRGVTHQNLAVISQLLRNTTEWHIVIPPSCGTNSKIKLFSLAVLKRGINCPTLLALQIPDSKLPHTLMAKFFKGTWTRWVLFREPCVPDGYRYWIILFKNVLIDYYILRFYCVYVLSYYVLKLLRQTWVSDGYWYWFIM